MAAQTDKREKKCTENKHKVTHRNRQLCYNCYYSFIICYYSLVDSWHSYRNKKRVLLPCFEIHCMAYLWQVFTL